MKEAAKNRRIAHWVTLLCLLITSSAGAQQYKSGKIDGQARFLRPAVQKSVRNNNFGNESEKQNFRKFFETYYFPAMTRPTSEGLGQMGKLTNDLFRTYLWSSQNQAAQADLTKYAFDYFRRVMAKTDFHPAVRLNAVLVLGKLDARYAVEAGGQKQPPQPYPDSSKLLIQVMENADKMRWITPSILSGALSGLERHARFHKQLPAALSRRLPATLLTVVERKEPFEGADSDVHFWLQRQAASGLAYLGSTGSDNRALKGLLSLVGNSEASLDGRTQVAALLEQLSFEGAKVDEQATTAPLILLAGDVAAESAVIAKEFDDLRMTGRGRATRRGGAVELERRQMLTWLMDVSAGLAAVKPVVGDKPAQAIDEVVAAMAKVRSAARDEKTIDLELVADIQQMAREIERVAGPWHKPAADIPETAEAGATEIVK